jgi:hypothetical protein
MGDRLRSFPGCAQVRTKVHRKEYGWFVRLVYDPRGLPGVTTVRPGVARGVLHYKKVISTLATSLPLNHIFILPPP